MKYISPNMTVEKVQRSSLRASFCEAISLISSVSEEIATSLRSSQRRNLDFFNSLDKEELKGGVN